MSSRAGPQVWFIDALTTKIREEPPKEWKRALVRIKDALERFKLTHGTPPSASRQGKTDFKRDEYLAEFRRTPAWQCFEGLHSDVELVHDLVIMGEIEGGFSKENCAALAEMLSNVRVTASNYDSLLTIANHLALSFMGAVAPNELQKKQKELARKRYGGKASGARRSLLAKQAHQLRVEWAASYISKNTTKNARKAIEAKCAISPRKASDVLRDAKKLCS